MVYKTEDLVFSQTKLIDQDTLTQEMDQNLLTQEAGQVMDLLTQEDQVMDLPTQMDKDQEVTHLIQADQEHLFNTLYPFLIIMVCRTSREMTQILILR